MFMYGLSKFKFKFITFDIALITVQNKTFNGALQYQHCTVHIKIITIKFKIRNSL